MDCGTTALCLVPPAPVTGSEENYMLIKEIGAVGGIEPPSAPCHRSEYIE